MGGGWFTVAADCDDAACTGGDEFLHVGVPGHDPVAMVAVQEVRVLLRASVQRQRSLLNPVEVAIASFSQACVLPGGGHQQKIPFVCS